MIRHLRTIRERIRYGLLRTNRGIAMATVVAGLWAYLYTTDVWRYWLYGSVAHAQLHSKREIPHSLDSPVRAVLGEYSFTVGQSTHTFPAVSNVGLPPIQAISVVDGNPPVIRLVDEWTRLNDIALALLVVFLALAFAKLASIGIRVAAQVIRPGGSGARPA